MQCNFLVLATISIVLPTKIQNLLLKKYSGQKRTNTVEVEGEDSPRTKEKKKNARVICSFELSEKAYHVKGGELAKERMEAEAKAAQKRRELGSFPSWNEQFSPETEGEQAAARKENELKENELKEMTREERQAKQAADVKAKALKFMDSYKHDLRPVSEEKEMFDKWFKHPEEAVNTLVAGTSRYPVRASTGAAAEKSGGSKPSSAQKKSGQLIVPKFP